MKGLCKTSIFTSGSGSFPPATDTKSEGSSEQIEKRSILIDDSSFAKRIR